MADKTFAIWLMVAQGALFTAEVTVLHHFGPDQSIVLFGAIRGLGSILLAMTFARRFFGVFATEQPYFQILRGLIVLSYGWVMVVSFGRLPLADATAISFTQIIWIALLSIAMLGETISARRWAAVAVGIAGVACIAKPSFSAIGIAYAIALGGAILNGLGFVLNRYSVARDTPETTAAWTGAAGFVGNLPLCFLFPPLISGEPLSVLLLVSLAILGPLGNYAGIVAAKYAEASVLGPYQLLRLVFGVLSGLLFLEIPDLTTAIGLLLIGISVLLNLQPAQKRSARFA